MPELPEVENVKRGLEALGLIGQTFSAVELKRKNLRTPLKRELIKGLPGQTILEVRRRAKYLLFKTQDYELLSHLGMTGSWRAQGALIDPPLKHDHVLLKFESGLTLIYHDPRRFGILELFRPTQKNRWIENLGLEPFDPQFQRDYLFEQTRGLSAPIKNVLMDQRRLVGVGNIYASEALYHAGVRPTRAAQKLTRAEAARLVDTVKSVLSTAISAGGSTIRDYRNANGESGGFQKQFAVYGRAGELCLRCLTPIKSKMIAGRNTFWCARCQC